MGKSKGYVFGRTGSGTYVSTDLPEAVVGAARRRNRMRLRRTPAAPTSARAFAELAPSRAARRARRGAGAHAGGNVRWRRSTPPGTSPTHDTIEPCRDPCACRERHDVMNSRLHPCKQRDGSAGLSAKCKRRSPRRVLTDDLSRSGGRAARCLRPTGSTNARPS
jgi:hypothetical protein